MYYQTPDMREITPDYYLPGEIVQVGNGAVAIKKSNGKYLTILSDGADSENGDILDQEWLLPTKNKSILMADRTARQGACYAIAIIE